MLQYPFIRLAPLSRMDDEMGSAAATLARRIEGRLFTDDGRLYFVLSVDPESGFAQVSHRADGRLQVSVKTDADFGGRCTNILRW